MYPWALILEQKLTKTYNNLDFTKHLPTNVYTR